MATSKPRRNHGAAALVLAVVATLSLGGCQIVTKIAAQAAGTSDTLIVQCDAATTTVLTPTVAVSADGVHLTVDNRSALDLALEFQWKNGGQGDDAPPGTTDKVFEFEPGAYQVRCFDTRQDNGIDSGWTAFTVVDPSGSFVPTSLPCVDQMTGISDFIAGAKGEAGDPLDIARRLYATGPTDTVEVAGTPLSAERHVRILRGGQPIAVVTITPDGAGGWLQSSQTVCAGFELG